MTDTLLEQTIRWLALLERRVDDLVEPEVISNAAGGRGVTPQVAYWTGTKTIGGDPGLTYDAANDALSMLSTISTEPILELQNTNVDALSGSIQFYKNSAAPADGDDLGAIEFYGETSTGAKERYAYMLAESDDITNGDTAGRFRLMMTMDAVERNMLDVDMYNGVVNQGTITFNTEGQDVDYYVESVGVADALFIRGSDGQITFGAYGPGYVYADAAGVLSAVVAPAPTPHAILSASHSDSVANVVNRGSLIYGNATPAWDELLLAGAAGSFVRRDAADVMWSTLVLPNAAATGDILYASGANTIGNLADVAVGQALVSGGVGVAPTYSASPTLTGLTLTGLTPSTVIYSNAARAITSLANAAGYLNNNGAGVLTWVAAPAPAAHNLLSASHGDSVANAVNRGSLIYGNASPAWDELNHPAAANRVLQSSAADVQWSAQTLVLTTSLTNQGANGVLNWGGAFTLTIPASGTAVLGTGANTRVAYWTGVNTVSGDAGFTYNSGTDSITLGGDIILTGGGAANIVILDNQLDALGIEDAGGLEYLMIRTNDTQPAVRFNDDGVDVDFYVEAVGHADALFIRGSDGQFTVGALGAGFVRSDAGGVLSSSALIAGDLPAHTHSGAGQGGSLVIGTTDTDATAGSVLFAGAAGVIQQDNANLFWDDGNNYLGLGTAAPNERLEVNHNANAFVGIRMDNPNAGNAAASSFYALNDTNGSLSFGKLGSGNITHTGYGAPNDTFIYSSATGGANLNIINAFATGNVAFYVGNTVAGGAATMILDGTNKRLGIGDATPDASLDVQTSDAVTAAITDVAILAHDTSGTAAVGFGAGLLYQLEDVGTTLRDAGRLAFQWEVAATATRRSRFVLHTCQTAGSLIEQGVVEAPITATVAANSRGAGAVDWQGLRSAGAQVASGAHSVISGGRYNTASGDYSTIIGGGSSIAIGDYSMAMGYQANAALQGAVAHASGAFATAGDVQHIRLMAWRQVVHSNTSWYTLYLDGAAALMTIPADTIWRFQVRIGGTTQGGGAGMDVWGYGITGLIENDNGTTTLLASVVTTNYEDDANFDARALADDPNDALLIQVQDAGASGASVRWGATLHITQVTYP